MSKETIESREVSGCNLDCPFYFSEEAWCNLAEDNIDTEDEAARPDWCPLPVTIKIKE